MSIVHRPTSTTSRRISQSCPILWHDDLRPAPIGEETQVQVIVMAVRDEDDIDVDVFEEVRHGVAVRWSRPSRSSSSGSVRNATPSVSTRTVECPR